MTQVLNTPPDRRGLPGWVPDAARHYVSHVEMGQPIRALARSAECHASTILRQIRRLETRRDDPLVDDALDLLGQVSRFETHPMQEPAAMNDTSPPMMPDDETLKSEAQRILRRLCETGALLAVAAEMDKAVVVRSGPDGAQTRTAVVDRCVAQAMALNGWIATDGEGRCRGYGDGLQEEICASPRKTARAPASGKSRGPGKAKAATGRARARGDGFFPVARCRCYTGKDHKRRQGR